VDGMIVEKESMLEKLSKTILDTDRTMLRIKSEYESLKNIRADLEMERKKLQKTEN
jgi:hypothetical protein